MKRISVLYEDDKLLVLNKPAGLPVQGGAGVAVSLDSLLAEHYTPRPLLVHRLDRDTSGVIVTAKTKETAAACSALFDYHREWNSDSNAGIKKTYLAVCAGILNETGTINETLEIKGQKLSARTKYRCLASVEDLDAVSLSLAEIQPATGRMHQIRRHLAQSNFPILGDDKYGDFALNKNLKKSLGLKRLLLHAYSIHLPPSLTQFKNGLEIFAPLPDHFLEILERTRLKWE